MRAAAKIIQSQLKLSKNVNLWFELQHFLTLLLQMHRWIVSDAFQARTSTCFGLAAWRTANTCSGSTRGPSSETPMRQTRKRRKRRRVQRSSSQNEKAEICSHFSKSLQTQSRQSVSQSVRQRVQPCASKCRPHYLFTSGGLNEEILGNVLVNGFFPKVPRALWALYTIHFYYAMQFVKAVIN